MSQKLPGSTTRLNRYPVKMSLVKISSVKMAPIWQHRSKCPRSKCRRVKKHNYRKLKKEQPTGCSSKNVFLFKMDLATNFPNFHLATRFLRTGFTMICYFLRIHWKLCFSNDPKIYN